MIFNTTNLSQGMKAWTKYRNTAITIYNSNKVMFQGKDAESVANAMLPNKSIPSKATPNTIKANKLNSTSPIINFNVSAATGAGSVIISGH